MILPRLVHSKLPHLIRGLATFPVAKPFTEPPNPGECDDDEILEKICNSVAQLKFQPLNGDSNIIAMKAFDLFSQHVERLDLEKAALQKELDLDKNQLEETLKSLGQELESIGGIREVEARRKGLLGIVHRILDLEIPLKCMDSEFLRKFCQSLQTRQIPVLPANHLEIIFLQAKIAAVPEGSEQRFPDKEMKLLLSFLHSCLIVLEKRGVVILSSLWEQRSLSLCTKDYSSLWEHDALIRGLYKYQPNQLTVNIVQRHAELLILNLHNTDWLKKSKSVAVEKERAFNSFDKIMAPLILDEEDSGKNLVLGNDLKAMFMYICVLFQKYSRFFEIWDNWLAYQEEYHLPLETIPQYARAFGKVNKYRHCFSLANRLAVRKKAPLPNDDISWLNESLIICVRSCLQIVYQTSMKRLLLEDLIPFIRTHVLPCSNPYIFGSVIKCAIRFDLIDVAGEFYQLWRNNYDAGNSIHKDVPRKPFLKDIFIIHNQILPALIFRYAARQHRFWDIEDYSGNECPFRDTFQALELETEFKFATSGSNLINELKHGRISFRSPKYNLAEFLLSSSPFHQMEKETMKMKKTSTRKIIKTPVIDENNEETWLNGFLRPQLNVLKGESYIIQKHYPLPEPILCMISALLYNYEYCLKNTCLELEILKWYLMLYPRQQDMAIWFPALLRIAILPCRRHMLGWKTKFVEILEHSDAFKKWPLHQKHLEIICQSQPES